MATGETCTCCLARVKELESGERHRQVDLVSTLHDAILGKLGEWDLTTEQEDHILEPFNAKLAELRAQEGGAIPNPARMTKVCTCSSHQFVECRGVETIGSLWHCEKTGEVGRAGKEDGDDE